MSVSYWRRTTRLGRIKADVAIVGAGVAGLCAAMHLRRRGLSFVVLEAREAGSGASSRNAGFLMRGAAESYARAADLWGRERVRALWAWTEENLKILRAWGVADLPSYRALPSRLLALDDAEAAELERSAPMLSEDGFATRLLRPGDPGTDDDAWGALQPRLALDNPHDATVSPWDLIERLRAAFAGSLIEGQEVAEIEAKAGGVRLRTPDAEVHAAHAIVCVNAYADRLASALPSLRGLVQPNRGQMLAALADRLRLGAAYYANYGAEYFRLTTDGVLVIGGCRAPHARDERTADDTPTNAVQADLESYAARLLGHPPRVVARWAGIMGFSPDGLPLIGPAESSGRIWFCGGFTGHGMSLAARAAAAAVDGILDGRPSPFPLEGRANVGVA